MKKKIGFISKTLNSGGGIELFEVAVAEKLSQRGWDIAIAYEQTGDLGDRWKQSAQMQQQELSAADANTAMAHFLRDCDVLYAHRPSDFSQTLCVSQMLHVPAVMHLHLPPWHLRKGWKRLILGSRNQNMDPKVFSKSSQVDRFLAVSQHTACSWIRSGIPKQKVKVVHNGVNPEVFRPGLVEEKSQIRQKLNLKPETVVIGYVGRIDETKGIQQLLQSFQIVSSKTAVPLTLLVIGEATRSLGERGVELTADLKQQSLGDVRWLGKRRDVDQLYRAIDILVIPSQWDEPFGLVAVEAMASQVPVIATRTGGLQEIFSGTIEESLVGKSPEAIASRLLELVNDEELRISLGIKGRNLILERFNLEHTVDQIEKQLLSVVTSNLMLA